MAFLDVKIHLFKIVRIGDFMWKAFLFDVMYSDSICFKT